MLYDAKKDKIELLEDNLKDSELFEKIQKSSGMTMKEMWESIRMNASSKSFLVEQKNKLELPSLIEAENTAVCNNKLVLLKEEQLEEHGSIDYDEVLGKWKYWLQKEYMPRLLKKKK